MARPLIVTRATERLHVKLPDAWAVADPAVVTLTVVHKTGSSCPMMLSHVFDPCVQLVLHPPSVDCQCWGVRHRCFAWNHHKSMSSAQKLCCDEIRLVEPLQAKVHKAELVNCGVATFVLDQDLTQAPKGWYRGYVGVGGHAVAELTIWVRSDPLPIRSG